MNKAIIVENNEPNNDVIHIRGRINIRSPTFDVCQQAREKKSFQKMLELSDEAVTTRTRLRQMLEGHPLNSKLKDMTTSEAMTYLLVMTEQVARWDVNRLSDKSGFAPGDMKKFDVSLQQSKHSDLQIPGSEIAINTNSGAVTLDLDDATFDAFSSFSTNH